MPKAKYEGIYHSLKKRIEAQDYPYQSLLPSENTLLEEYACSRNTVRRALAELTNDGYVQAMQGRGVRVIYQPVGKTTFTIGGIETFQGLTPEIAANSIYDYIENTLGMQIITSKRRITVEHATAQDEKVLAMDSYDCVAVVTNQTFNASGMLFEFTQSRHQPDYFCFQDIATRKK